MSNGPIDPFAGGEKAPALSFKDAPHGTTYTGRVTSAPTLVQSIDFETGERATWPDGNPKMSVVIGLEVNGEARSLWAAKPSAMFAACAEAQRVAGGPICPGGTLEVVYTHDIPNAKNPRLNPAKQYAVRYTPPNPFGDEAGVAAARPAGPSPAPAWAAKPVPAGHTVGPVGPAYRRPATVAVGPPPPLPTYPDEPPF